VVIEEEMDGELSSEDEDEEGLFVDDVDIVNESGQYGPMYLLPLYSNLSSKKQAQIFDAGTHYIVSGHSESRVQEAVHALALQGCRLISPMTQVGSKWIASVDNPKLAVPATVQELGYKCFVSGPTRESVMVKVQDLLERGAVLIRDAELADGVWTAVCEKT
jgi:hypothetical protein